MNPTPLAPTAQALLAYIRETGPTDASNRILRAVLDVDRATVKRALRSLETAGLIIVDRRVPDAAAGDETGRTIAPAQVNR